MNKHFTKEDTQKANKNRERGSASAARREVQPEVTMTCHFIPIRWCE